MNASRKEITINSGSYCPNQRDCEIVRNLCATMRCQLRINIDEREIRDVNLEDYH